MKPTQKQIDASNAESFAQLFFELKKEFWFLKSFYYNDHEGVWCAEYENPLDYEEQQFDTYSEAIAYFRKQPVRIISTRFELQHSDDDSRYAILVADTDFRRAREIGRMLKDYPKREGFNTKFPEQWESQGLFFALASYSKRTT
jgi:hypothetical protein